MPNTFSHRDYDGDDYFFGTCLAHHNFELMYVPIEKNVTKVVRSILLRKGFQEYNFHESKKHSMPAMIILRDPVDRWISGIVEYLLLVYMDTRQSLNNITRHNLTSEKVFDQLVFDAHTFPQSWFLKGIEAPCDYIWFDENKKTQLIETVSKYLVQHGVGKDWDVAEYAHDQNSISMQKQELTQLYKDLLAQDSQLLERVKSFYSEDYRLIDSVKFYT
jgi:hypothetical protein